MQRTVFIAGLTIALAGSASASVNDTAKPSVMSYNEFAFVSELAGWSAPAVNDPYSLSQDELARRGRGRDDPAGDDHGQHGAGHATLELNILTDQPLSRRGRGGDDPAGDDHGQHGAGHA